MFFRPILTATPPLPMFLLLALLLTSPGGSAGSAAAVASAAWKSSANVVTLSNGEARRDTDGKIVDSHSGNVVLLNGRFFLYGERYGKNIGMGKDQPKLSVYSSPTMESGSWEDHGDLDVVGNWSWPTKPHGTFFTPWAVVDPKTKRVVMWFNAYMNGCCDGNFGTASSDDGLHFTLHTLEVQVHNETSTSTSIFGWVSHFVPNCVPPHTYRVMICVVWCS